MIKGSRSHKSIYPKLRDKPFIRKCLLQDRLSVSEVARKIGCFRGSVQAILSLHLTPAEIASIKPGKVRISNEHKKQVVREILQGAKPKHIAAREGVNIHTIYKWLRLY